jgi:hypothetical protein
MDKESADNMEFHWALVQFRSELQLVMAVIGSFWMNGVVEFS